MRAQYDLEREQDIEAFRLKKRKQAISWTSRNKALVSSYCRKYKNKVREQRKHSCDICDKAFTDSSKLNRHLNSDLNKRKASGQRPTAKVLSDARRKTAMSAIKKFYCAACKQNFTSPSAQDNHNLSDKHLRNVTATNSVLTA